MKDKIMRAAAFMISLLVAIIAIFIIGISCLIVGVFEKKAFIRDYEDE